MRHSPNAVSMLDQRLRRWPNIKPPLSECAIFAGKDLLSIHLFQTVGVGCFVVLTVKNQLAFKPNTQLRTLGG